MAQKRLRDYKEPLTSFDHNLINLGVHKQGRFIGFDVANAIADLTFQIAHTGANYRVKNDVNALIGPLGIYMTTQGVMIIEDTPLANLILDTNLGNTQIRYDLLVANHAFSNVSGGQIATYSIVKGAFNDANRPVLPNADFQTVLGEFILQPGATTYANIIYKKAKSPDSGDGEDARLNEPNRFTKTNSLAVSSNAYSVPDAVDNFVGLFKLRDDGNTYEFNQGSAGYTQFGGIKIGNDSPIPDGTEIKFKLGPNVALISFPTITVANRAIGYSPIIIPPEYLNQLVNVGGTNTPGVGSTTNDLYVTLLKIQTNWLVIAVTGLNYSREWKRGMSIEADLSNGEIADNFDATGLGKNFYSGWAICNGLNGTVDKRCRVSIMASEIPNLGANALNLDLLRYQMGQYNAVDGTSGAAKVAMTANNMAKHHHKMFVNQKNGAKTFTANQYVVWSSNNDNGNQDYDLCRPTADNILPTIGKTSEAGSDNPTPIVTLPPFVVTLKIMKL